MNTTDYDLKTGRNAARSIAQYQNQCLHGASAAELGQHEPREPGPLGKATETLGYLNELEGLHSDIRRKMYAPFPVAVGPDAKEKRLEPPSLEEMLSMICQRIACLTSDARSLLSRMD